MTVPSAIGPVRIVVVNAAHDALAAVLRVTQVDPLADKVSTALNGVRAARVPRASKGAKAELPRPGSSSYRKRRR